MREQDHGLANPVQESSAGGLYGRLLVSCAGEKFDVGGVVGIEDWVTHFAGTWPLRVQFRLRPKVEVLACSETLLNDLGAVGCESAISRHPSRATAEGLIDDVDGVAMGRVERGPSTTPIWLVEPIGSGLGLAVDEDDGVLFRPSLYRRQPLNIHLIHEDMLARSSAIVDISTASVEVISDVWKLLRGTEL